MTTQVEQQSDRYLVLSLVSLPKLSLTFSPLHISCRLPQHYLRVPSPSLCFDIHKFAGYAFLLLSLPLDKLLPNSILHATLAGTALVSFRCALIIKPRFILR